MSDQLFNDEAFAQIPGQIAMPPDTTVEELLREWAAGAAERERLIRKAGAHGVGTVEYRRWMGKDHALCGRMLDIAGALRALGVQPPYRMGE